MRKFYALMMIVFMLGGIHLLRFYFGEPVMGERQVVINVGNQGEFDIDDLHAKIFMLDGSGFFVSSAKEIEWGTKNSFVFDIPAYFEGEAKIVVETEDNYDSKFVVIP